MLYICDCKLASSKSMFDGHGIPVRDHIKYSAKFGGLVELACSHAIECVQEAGNEVCNSAISRVEAHEMQRYRGQDDTCVPCWFPIIISFAWKRRNTSGGLTDEVWHEKEDIF